MKVWRKHERFLSSGEWHVHTSYTDGENSVQELCKQAMGIGIPLISFTEHVRKDLDYDIDSLLEEIDRARDMFPGLIILSGAEAKVLPDGSLDADDDVLRKVDYPTFSFHSFPRDKELYLRCLKNAIQDRRVNTWDHPGLFLKKNGMTLSEAEVEEVFRLMRDNGVLLEINGKHGLPPAEWIAAARQWGVKTVRGDDIHRLEDFENRKKIWW